MLHGVVRWICGHVLPPLAYPVISGPLRGARFILGAAAGEGGGASVYVNGIEREQTQALLGILRPGQVFFDVGANVGYYTLLASRRVGPSGRVLAFEPAARNISYLHRHVALNGAENVSILAMACSDRSAVQSFAAGANNATGRLIEDHPGRPADGRSECVTTVAIDEIVRQSGLVPDVVKIDVEGAEELVLKGATKTLASARPVVFLSVHSAALQSACTTHLRGLGYKEPVVCAGSEGDAELLFTHSSAAATTRAAGQSANS